MKTMRKILVTALLAVALIAPQASAGVVDWVDFSIPPVVMVWASDDLGVTNNIVQDFYLMDYTAGGTAATDLIGGLEVSPYLTSDLLTGTLTPIQPIVAGDYTPMDIINSPTGAGPFFTDTNANGYLDAGDTFTPFELDATTDVSLTNTMAHSFFVASNCPFAIYGQAVDGGTTLTGMTLANITYSCAITVANVAPAAVVHGSQAQDPTGGGAGYIDATVNDLGDMDPVPVEIINADQATAAGVGTIMEQSVEIRNTYGLSFTYDLSNGYGMLSAVVTYTVYNP